MNEPGKQSKNFDPIAEDYAFFENHSTEADQDLDSYLKYCKNQWKSDVPFHFLDFGCGTGKFTDRLLKALQVEQDLLHITLIEPGSISRNVAVQTLKVHTQQPVRHCRQLSDLPRGTWNLIIANHSLYYVRNLVVTLVQLKERLKPNGQLLVTMAGSDNQLIQFWQQGFQLLDIPIPYSTADDLLAALEKLGYPFKRQKVAYSIQFSDCKANRMHLLRFLFAQYLNTLDEAIALRFFDSFVVGNEIRIETKHDLMVIQN